MKIIPVDDINALPPPPVNNQQITVRNRPPGVIVDGGLQPSMPRTQFISDPALIPRVYKYLENNVDKTYIDINVMADDLQKIYKDYARRKRVPFRHSVKKAYNIVTRSYGQDNNISSSEEEISDDTDIEEESQFNSTMNNQMLDLYKLPKPLDENELIDISSDEEDTAQPQLQSEQDHLLQLQTQHLQTQLFPQQLIEKATNGASTSQKPKTALSIWPINKKATTLISLDEIKKEKSPSISSERGKKRKNENQFISELQSPLKKKRSVANLTESSITFKDVGGIDKVLENVCKLLVHIRHPEVYEQIGISSPRGFLLYGPPGCGKTLLANAIAGELGIPLLKIAGPELIAGVSGESEERIRELFERAISTAPCVLFIDEVDTITPNRMNAQKEMEKRIVAQLLSCLDDLSSNENGNQVLVIGATNRPDSMDPALRRAGRFDREVCLGIPDVQARAQILKVLSSKLKLGDGFDFSTIAKYTPGFVGADLMALIREAAMAAVNRVFNTLKEKNELMKALALQKASKELAQKQSAATQSQVQSDISTNPAESEDSATNNATVSSSDANDIEVVDQINTTNDSENIVVIDDDVKSDNKADSEIKMGETEQLSEEQTEKLQKALHLLQEPKTVLESLISWLHDQAPLTNEELTNLYITMDDFAVALKLVQPSAKREGFATVPDVTWDDVGSLRDIREELQMAILAPVKHAEQFKALGLTTPTGVLLCGPPGCGKTLLAKAIANEAGINFISVKGPELLNMYVGESEKAVRLCFERARNSAPCVIFFDELDSLCPKRSDSGEGGVTSRVVNQMLTEMDGIEGRVDVYLLAATNRPDIVDPAVLRPGRLDKIIYVGLPTADDRVDILRAVTKNGTKPQLAPDVDLEVIGKSEQCDGYTGADLAALVREAGVVALKDYVVHGNNQPLAVTTEHFKRAVAKIRPSISEKDQKHYEKLKKIYSVPSSADGVEEMEYS